MLFPMEKELVANLKAISEPFATATGLSLSTIWMRAAKDARFMARVDNGSSFTIKTYDSILTWFSANWPANLAWPETIQRPPNQSPASTHGEAA